VWARGLRIKNKVICDEIAQLTQFSHLSFEVKGHRHQTTTRTIETHIWIGNHLETMEQTIKGDACQMVSC
jgi:hypothetical protein